jgi:RimJ/RimL family protein N-acetyltransferase
MSPADFILKDKMKKILLETERLCLREYTQDDFDGLRNIISDGETMKYYPRPYDEAGVQRWLDWSFDNYKKHGFGLFAIELRKTGEFVGDAGITLQHIDGEWLPEIGYHVNKNFWRRGIASEAARAVRDWAFSNFEFDALYSYMASDNIPSQATARSVGMTKLKEYSTENENLTVYKITREEWKKCDNDN